MQPFLWIPSVPLFRRFVFSLQSHEECRKLSAYSALFSNSHRRKKANVTIYSVDRFCFGTDLEETPKTQGGERSQWNLAEIGQVTVCHNFLLLSLHI